MGAQQNRNIETSNLYNSRIIAVLLATMVCLGSTVYYELTDKLYTAPILGVYAVLLFLCSLIFDMYQNKKVTEIIKFEVQYIPSIKVKTTYRQAAEKYRKEIFVVTFISIVLMSAISNLVISNKFNYLSDIQDQLLRIRTHIIIVSGVINIQTLISKKIVLSQLTREALYDR